MRRSLGGSVVESPLESRREAWFARMPIPPRAAILLCAVLACELSTLLVKAINKAFWFDELITFNVSGLQPFSQLLKAIQEGLTGMPLGYYLITRVASLLPGTPHITLRLPSLFGYLLALLGTYWFARKRLPEVAALTAVLLIAISPFREYALEARSYSLVVGFLVISAVIWQRLLSKETLPARISAGSSCQRSCGMKSVVPLL